MFFLGIMSFSFNQDTTAGGVGLRGAALRSTSWVAGSARGEASAMSGPAGNRSNATEP
jgi:hypothetical protein